MSSNLHDPDAGTRSVPQCGFGTDIDFDTLIKTNPFLFRVYTPKERSPFSDDTDPFFIAPRFNEQVARSPVDLPDIKFPETVVGSYAEVARHMEWTTKSSSCYISGSFSFAWAIWEAVKRYHTGVKKDVEIAIIDSSALGGRAATAVQLLMKSTPRQRDEQFWKWHRFSQDSQTVLVYGMVPRPAVLASIPLLQILRKMPSYFLQKDIQVIPGNPLDQVAWNYASRKLNYRQFCQDMSGIFLSRPTDVRLRDSTGGAVRLALSFLRPFFHRAVQDDFEIAISNLRSLALIISEWPGDGWVRDHPETQQVIESMVLALGEELREKYAQHHQEEVSHLKGVIDGLERTIRTQNELALSHVLDEFEIGSDGDLELEFEESDEPTLVTFEPLSKSGTLRSRPSSLNMSIAVLPRLPTSFQTPITPPESPRNSLFLPTITIPLTDAVSTQFSFKAIPSENASNDAAASTSPKTSPSSDEPTSPPLTPPPRSPVFSRPKSPLVESSPPDVQHDETADEPLLEEEAVPEYDQELEEIKQLEHEIEETLARDVLGHHMLDEIIEDDGEETELEDDATSPPSPLMSWGMLSASGFSSRRSSIISMETLCESPGLPVKRLSYVRSRTTSLDFTQRLSFTGSVGILSRTVSFSEPMLGLIPHPTPPVADPQIRSPSAPQQVEPWSVPLPTSPAMSERSLSPSNSSSSSPSVSPSASMSSICSSSTGSSHPSPPSPPALTLDRELPTKPSSRIVLPRRSISLMSPLSEPDEDTDSDTMSIRSTGVGETASYIVTGFLVGAFITLLLFSTQRRTLLYVT